MDCRLGSLMTSCFPVMCVEKCLVASRLCPGISHCTQVRQGLPVLVTGLRNSLGLVLGERKMVRRGVCEPSLAHLEQSQVQEQDIMSERAQRINISFFAAYMKFLLTKPVDSSSSTPDCKHQLVTKLGDGVLKRRHSIFFDGFGVFLDRNIIRLMNFSGVGEQQKIWPWRFRSVKLKGLSNSLIFALIIQRGTGAVLPHINFLKVYLLQIS